MMIVLDGWMDGSQLCLGATRQRLFIFNELRFQSMLPNFTHSLFFSFFLKKERNTFTFKLPPL